MQKYFNKKNFYNEINGFYRRIKLKAKHILYIHIFHIFRKPTDKTSIPLKATILLKHL